MTIHCYTTGQLSVVDDHHQPGPHHSAEVSMYLEANGRRIQLAGVLENRCTLRKPTTLGPCEADFVTIIDGEEYRKRMSFPDGISDESLNVGYTPVASD